MLFAGIISQSDKIKVSYSQLLESTITNLAQKITTINNDDWVLFWGKLHDQNDTDEMVNTDTSIILGRIFSKSDYQPLTSEQCKAVSFEQDPAALMTNYWGKYVSIMRDEYEGIPTFKITRDPTGQLPFFYCFDKDQNVVFSSDIQIILDFLKLDFLKNDPEFNVLYLTNYLLYGAAYSNKTPFEKILELPPGHTLIIKSNSLKIEEAWNPRTYYTHIYQQENLIETGKNTLRAWTNNYKNIFLSLSGGLDSTALLCLLNNIKQPHQNLVAINFFHSQTKTSNEFHHAQDICSKLNVTLEGIDFVDAVSLDDLHSPFSICPNKPLPAMINFNQHKILSAFIHAKQSSVFISGHGGDHLFMRPPPESSLADYFFEKGIRGLKPKLEDLASFLRKPLTSILKSNIKESILAFRNKNDIPNSFENPGWIKQDMLANSHPICEKEIYSQFSNIWLPGKRQQLESIKCGFPTIYLEYIAPSNPTFYPLLYQPLMELVLALPTYDLYEKGYDRYPFRKAIADHYKIDNVWRREKGETTGIFQLGLKKNIDKIMALCSEGYFNEQGFIDREGLFKHIRQVSCGSTRALWPLINLISAEIFLASWKNHFNTRHKG